MPKTLRRPPFDRRYDFVALREMRLSGKLVPAETPIDKTLVEPRRLRQMYDVRLIELAPGQKTLPRAARPRAVGTTRLPGEPEPPAPARGVVRRRMSRAA